MFKSLAGISMKKRYIKLIFEIILILTMLVGYNIGKIKPEYSTFGNLIASVIFISWIILLIIDREGLNYNKVSLIYVIARLLVPVLGIIFTIFFFKPEREKVEETPRFEKKATKLECKSFKYGKFLSGIDTVERKVLNGNDIEIIIKENHIDTFRVKWIDSCYYRVEKGNKYELVRILEVFGENYFEERTDNLFDKKVNLCESITNAR